MTPYPATSRTLVPAAELLDVTNRSELEEVLGTLVAAGARDAGGILPAGTARALVGVLRRTAERTLPTLATALGEGAGERSAAETAARLFGLELEGASAEDRDFEVARQLVRFGRAAAARAARAPAGPPAVIVEDAIENAGRQFAPGLLRAVSRGPAGPVAPAPRGGPRTGPWVRSGSTVVLLGVRPTRY